MKKIFTLLFVAIFAQWSMAQKTVYFPGFELINLYNPEGLEYSTSKLIKSYIEDNHDFTIIVDERIGTETYDVRTAASEAMKKAQTMNSRYFMLGEIHFLEGVFIVSLGLYEAQTNERVWHDMAKGAAEQDLDPLLSRLGRSFFTRKTAKTDINIDEVTEYDQQGIELSQIKVNHYAGILLGGKHLSGENTLSGFGLAYTYDASSALFNLDFEFYPSSNILNDNFSDERTLQNGTINLGVTYPFSRKRSTFFVNGGMEYGYSRIKDFYFDQEYTMTSSGVGVYAGGGFLMNRNSTVNLRIFAAVSVPFYEVDNTNLTAIKFGIVTSFAKK